MLMKLARWLPYWLVMWINRNQYSADGQAHINFSSGKLLVTFYRMGEGEFVIFSQDIQNRYNELKELKREKKLDKKLDKINKQLSADYWLKKEVKEQFEREKENEQYY